MITGMAVPTPTLIYAWPKTKEEFDKISAPETVHEWKPDELAYLLKKDGGDWERRCHSKQVGGKSLDEPVVVFQWFEERPVSA